MNKLIHKIKSNTLLSILTAIILGYLVIQVSRYFSSITVPFIKQYFELNFYTQQTFFKLYMLLFSILVIWIVNNKSVKNYGFTSAKNIKYSRMILITIGISILSFIVGNMLFNGVLAHLFPTGNTKSFSPPNSILEMILTVWIWSSICEEVLVRGLVQGFTNHLKNTKLFGLSISVIVSGLFFGAMHLSLFKAGMGLWFVCFIVFDTTVIGILAAYYREKSDSLLPPIFIHFLANFIGSLPLIIITILGLELPM